MNCKQCGSGIGEHEHFKSLPGPEVLCEVCAVGDDLGIPADEPPYDRVARLHPELTHEEVTLLISPITDDDVLPF